LASREGGALLGYNKYNDDSDESSSDSEPEQPSIDEIDVSTLSFVSNGERVWRAPDRVFSKRNSYHPDETEQDAGKRNSGGEDSNDSRRSSAGPHIPTLNFGAIVKEQRDPHRPSSARLHNIQQQHRCKGTFECPFPINMISAVCGTFECHSQIMC
jgi:hypothetical protein